MSDDMEPQHPWAHQTNGPDPDSGRSDRVTSGQAGGDETGGKRGPKQADSLITLAAEAELFHDTNGVGYVDLDIAGHRETWRIRSREFKRWLAHQFFKKTRGAPSSEALQSALGIIEAKAQFEAVERPIYLRIGGFNGKIYVNLADERWRAVEIDSLGWRVIDRPPVRFRRAAGMKPLCEPERGGSVAELETFVNLASEADFVIAVAWALAALRDCGPYPVLALSGEQGTAKSTLAAILRELVDPNAAPLRTLPRDDRDAFIAATNGHVVAFDNISGLSDWISDTLCRLATGGGFATRQLYSDQDEVLFNAMRPIVLNGIEDVVTRADLADRSVILTLEPIPDEKRRDEKELWAEFYAARPRILGALLDAVACGLRELPSVCLSKKPRMADFAIWGVACEKALWHTGAFIAAYDQNRSEVVENVIDSDLLAVALRSLMATCTMWTGTTTNLLAVLTENNSERVVKSKLWPKSAKGLSERLRRLATFLRKIGIAIEFHRSKRSRTITISGPAEKGEQQASPASPPSPSHQQPNGNIDLTGGRPGIVNGRNVSPGSVDASPPSRCVTPNSLKTRGGDAGDGGDARIPTVSGLESYPWRGRL